MAIDPYTLCPGGTGKKMKFCCPDLLGEWEKIQRMLDGDQWQACLEHVEKLENTHPERACLLSVKTALLRDLERFEDAKVTADAFLAKYPDNPTALAEVAMVTANLGQGRAAIEHLQRALEASTAGILARVYEAMTVVAEALLEEGEFLAAEGLLWFAVNLDHENEEIAQLWSHFLQLQEIPLALKDSHRLSDCPAEAPWREDFAAAMAPAMRGAWRMAVQKLTALLEKVGDAPAIWRNLAVLRGWLGDAAGAVEALRKFATMDVPLDEAVEAETLAQVIDPREGPEWVDGLAVTYPVSDAGEVVARLEADRRFLRLRVGPDMQPEGEPLPKAQFLLLDRPQPTPGEQVTFENMASQSAQIQVFGRETDRPARLVLVTARDERFATSQDLLAEVVGDAMTLPGDEKVLGKISAVQQALSMRFVPPAQTTPDRLHDLIGQAQRAAVLNRWPLLPLDALDGKTAREAAGDPAYRVKLLAAILLLEAAMQQKESEVDFNELRAQLGLPAAEGIDGSDPRLRGLSVLRWSQVNVKTLSNDQLLSLYRLAMAFVAVAALRKLAREVVDRPALDDVDTKLSAANILVRIELDSRERLKYVQKARDLAVAKGQSSAPFDLAELIVRIERGEMEPAVELVNHLQTAHAKEPGVLQQLAETLMHFGLIRPDGTPAAPPPQEQPSIVVPGGSAAQAGKLWTPGGETSSGEKPALWTPGMD